jgi:uncharacterized protein
MDIGFYGGEPLLNMGFIKKVVGTVNLLKHDNEIEITFSMTTNATLLHRHIDFLVANNFRLLISLDGNEENQSYRIFSKNDKNSFLKVTENIDAIQRDHPEYFADRVRFNAVLHNRNSVKEIYEFIYGRYNKIPRISELALDDMNLNKKDTLLEMFQSNRDSEIEYQKIEPNLLQKEHHELSLYKELTEFLKYYSINYYVSNISMLAREKEEYLPTSTCLPFSRKVFYTTQNALLPCEKINYKYSMGKVDESIIIDFQEVAQRYNRYYEHFKKICLHCYAYKFCGLCLFTVRNLDKLNSERFVCHQFYDQRAFKNKLYHVFSFLEKYPDDFFHILEDVTIS